MSPVDDIRRNQQTPAGRTSPFFLLWTTSTAGYFAGWVMKLAIPITAAQLTTSPLLVSGVPFAWTAPWLLIGLQAGALADRLDRRYLLLITASTRIFTLGSLILAAVFHAASLPLLYGTAFFLGCTETLTDTAATALLPSLVAPGHLERANVRLIGAQQLMEVIALPAGGAIAALGLALAGGLSSAGAIVALIALLFLRGAFRPTRSVQNHLVAEIAQGVRFLWQQPILRTVAVMAAVINACWAAWLAVLVLYAVEPGPLRLSPFQYGLLLAGSGIGGMLGTALVAPVQRWLGGRWLFGLNILGNALLFLAPALTTNAWVIGAAIVLGGIGGPMWAVAAVSLQQRLAPESLQGRLTAAYRFLGLGAEAIGPVIGGLIGQSLGIQVVFVGSALLTAFMLVPFFRVITRVALAGENRHSLLS